jgi:acyl-CoA synthetase (AMP-forming)/AMP-acid ligase II
LVLAIEGPDSGGSRARLREAMAAEHDLAIGDLLFVAAGRLPRTTSGKISRTACRRLYLESATMPNRYGGRNRRGVALFDDSTNDRALED